jgi:hypothetical protein
MARLVDDELHRLEPVRETERVRRVRLRAVADPLPFDELAVWLPMILVGALIGALARLL